MADALAVPRDVLVLPTTGPLTQEGMTMVPRDLHDTLQSGQQALTQLATALSALEATAKAPNQQAHLQTCALALQLLDQTLRTMHGALQQGDSASS